MGMEVPARVPRREDILPRIVRLESRESLNNPFSTDTVSEWLEQCLEMVVERLADDVRRKRPCLESPSIDRHSIDDLHRVMPGISLDPVKQLLEKDRIPLERLDIPTAASDQ